jgi:hypothetical protein
VNYWLKVAGSGDAPITDPNWWMAHLRWSREHGDFSGFPRRPTVEPGDRLVSYAAGSGQVFLAPRFFAVAESISWPELSDHSRWAWGVKTRMVVPGPLLTHAPTLHQLDVNTKSVRSQSHIRLSEEQGLEAEALLRGAVAKYGTPYGEEEEPAAGGRLSSARIGNGGSRELQARRERIQAIKDSGKRMALPELDAGLRRQAE